MFITAYLLSHGAQQIRLKTVTAATQNKFEKE